MFLSDVFIKVAFLELRRGNLAEDALELIEIDILRLVEEACH